MPTKRPPRRGSVVPTPPRVSNDSLMRRCTGSSATTTISRSPSVRMSQPRRAFWLRDRLAGPDAGFWDAESAQLACADESVPTDGSALDVLVGELLTNLPGDSLSGEESLEQHPENDHRAQQGGVVLD